MALLLTSLLIVGCQSTVPVSPQFETLDPFRFAAAPLPVQHRDTPLWNFTFLEEPPPEEQDIDENPNDEIPDDLDVPNDEEVPEPEFSFEFDTPPPLTEAEQAGLLAQNQWTKNHARIIMLDTGKTLNPNALSSEERQRRDQINRINMSQQEQANRQSQQWEYIDGTASEWRWMHRGIEKLSAIPPEQRAHPRKVFLNDKYKNQRILQANAAILWGRDGAPEAARLLRQLVQSEAVHIHIRCAAAEVLGRMPTVAAEELIPLLESVKDREVNALNRQTGEMEPRHQPGITEIWEELLIAIAEKIAPWEHPCFLEPFYSSTSKIRLETAKIWRRKSLQQRLEGTLPEKFLEIARREGNAEVRVEIIRTLAAWDVPDLFRFLENDLRNPIAEVRNAAMLALADTRNREAVPFAKNQLRDSVVAANRAAAVSALRKIGEFDELFRLADDPAAQVRLEVARALAERCTPQTANLARTYISDRSRDVQQATLEAVAGWSLEESGAVFLTAVKSMHREIRHRAVEMLAQRGVSHSGFDPEARPESQTMQYQELVEVFREKTGIDPRLDFIAAERPVVTASASVPDSRTLEEIRRSLDDWADRTLSQTERQLLEHRLKQHGQRLMPAVDHLMTAENRRIPESLDRVFAEVEPMFREMDKLRSGDIPAKRNAARELARLGAMNSPSKLAARRIIDLTARENDPMVLASLLSSLQHADPELVCQLARPLLQSESPEVRRVSCEMLMQFGKGEDVVLLQEALHDSSQAVVRDALRAIDYLWDESADNSAVLATLKSMLHQQGDAALQVDVAATLHRFGYSEGTEALGRFAASSDFRVKAHLAVRVAELQDERFVPILIRFLDDSNATVRSRALEALPRLVGQDIGRAGASRTSDVAQTQQQIDLWKAWDRERR